MMKNYGECNNTTTVLDYTHLNNNNDNNKCEHVQHTQYRRIEKDNISTCTWVPSSAQLYLRSNNNSHKERTRDPILILSNNNLLEYGGLEMSLGTVSNIIVSITFRGVG